MKCARCNTRLMSGWNFCPNCGMKVKTEDQGEELSRLFATAEFKALKNRLALFSDEKKLGFLGRIQEYEDLMNVYPEFKTIMVSATNSLIRSDKTYGECRGQSIGWFSAVRNVGKKKAIILNELFKET